LNRKKKFISISTARTNFSFNHRAGALFPDRWLEHTAPVLLVNFGICGGLDLALPLFQNFLSGRFLIWMIGDFHRNTFPYFPEQLTDLFSACRLLSSGLSGIAGIAPPKKLYQQSGCQLLDMEGYSLAKAAQKYAIPSFS